MYRYERKVVAVCKTNATRTPSLEHPELFQIIKRSCDTVLSAKGVITKVTYNGHTELAYTIRKTHGHYPEAEIWQLRFHAAPDVLRNVNHDLATDENVLRYQVTRSRDLPRIKQWRVLQHYGRKAQLDGLQYNTNRRAEARSGILTNMQDYYNRGNTQHSEADSTNAQADDIQDARHHTKSTATSLRHVVHQADDTTSPAGNRESAMYNDASTQDDAFEVEDARERER